MIGDFGVNNSAYKSVEQLDRYCDMRFGHDFGQLGSFYSFTNPDEEYEGRFRDGRAFSPMDTRHQISDIILCG